MNKWSDGPGQKIALALGAILVVGAATLVTSLPTLQATEVQLQPIARSGPDPFMPPMGRDRIGVKPPPDPGRPVPSGVPGLYGGPGEDAGCDAGRIGQFLGANPAKASAWAAALDVDPTDIPRYLSTLTPAVLRSDTYVTNHGFVDGSAVPRIAVLEAGTAVLVDRFGVPRVRCACGNPLGRAERPAGAKYAGPSWPHFAPTQVTTITVDARTEITIVLNDPGRPQPVTISNGRAEVTGPCTTDTGPVRLSAVISGQPGTEVGYRWIIDDRDGSPPETTVLPLAGNRTVSLETMTADSTAVLQIDSPHRVTSDPVVIDVECADGAGSIAVVGGTATPADGPCIDGARQVEFSATVTGPAATEITYRWTIEGAGTDAVAQTAVIPESGTLAVQRIRVQPPGTSHATVAVLTPSAATATIASTVTCDNPVPDPALTLSTATVHRGEDYSATATGFQPGEPVRFAWTGDSTGVLRALPADDAGSATVHVTEGEPAGSYTITATGLTSGRTASAPLTVTDRDEPARITVALTAQAPEHDGPCPEGVPVQLWADISGPPGASIGYRFIRSDGSSTDWYRATIPSSGTVRGGDGGQFQPGDHSVTVEVNGSNSASDRAGFTVSCPQDTPTAAAVLDEEPS